METILVALGFYFLLPFLLGALATTLGALVDGLARLIHGPAPVPTAPPAARSRGEPAYPPIALARLGPA